MTRAELAGLLKTFVPAVHGGRFNLKRGASHTCPGKSRDHPGIFKHFVGGKYGLSEIGLDIFF